MDNLNDLKSIWLSAKTESLPAADEMMHIIKEYRNKTFQRKVMVILTMAVSVTILIGITCIYKAKMPTTRIGQYSTILAGFVLIFSNVRSIKRFYNVQDFNNRDFIKFLEKTRQNQIYFYKKTQVAGLAFWSFGLLFYIFEFVHQNVFLFITIYSLTVIFLVILWLFVRQRVYNKRAKKLEEMIKRLESLSKQY
jgi:sensor c-di-GMP phosphodiesterase-like protein